MINVSVSDPFRKKRSFKSTLEDKTFTRTSTNYSYSRMFRVYVSYQFGELKEKIKKAKRSISNDDLKSGGNGGQTGGAGGEVTPEK